jgi:hypothetical protein
VKDSSVAIETTKAVITVGTPFPAIIAEAKQKYVHIIVMRVVSPPVEMFECREPRSAARIYVLTG